MVFHLNAPSNDEHVLLEVVPEVFAMSSGFVLLETQGAGLLSAFGDGFSGINCLNELTCIKLYAKSKCIFRVHNVGCLFYYMAQHLKCYIRKCN